MTVRWSRVFTEWIRCIFVLVHAYTRDGPAASSKAVVDMLVKHSIVPRVLAIANELLLQSKSACAGMGVGLYHVGDRLCLCYTEVSCF